ncbi:hypothetical protein [Streptomyces indiaensis]|uniref:Uncharacterized protein n=1 Tax=Streptomyces indiaensis TaxID=284033 RepID=A0ABN3D4I9_9ACTN|nr:hypothetical protein [Streptomyces indiaensis]MCF1645485.1 hypothetical protein [Streptomyces indiaensis]
MAHHTVIPPVDLNTNGHGAFVVQAAEAARERDDQLAAESARQHPEHRPCPDGVGWCTGDPENHADPREHRHTGREYALTGRYLQDPDRDGIAAVQLAAWDDDAPRLTFQGTGLWPELDLAQTDDLVRDAVPWVIGLLATRRRFAIALEPGKTPFTESETEQTSAAAFSLAARALETALSTSANREQTIRAFRSLLDLHTDEAGE